MKIYLANESKQGLGGGWTFMQNIKEAMALIKADVQFVNDINEADIYFISGSSMVSRDEVLNAKQHGKKIVLRVDNIARNSRNRNTGTTRLYDMAQVADHIIFQSKWAKEKILPLINSERDDISNEFNQNLYGSGGRKTFDISKTSIIYNGANTHIFTRRGNLLPKVGIDTRYLIVRYNRDNNKRIEESLDIYTSEWIKNKNIELWIIGQFSREMVAAYFDFYLGERYSFMGVIENRTKLASLMRSCDALIYPSYSDACPNTVIEARACGLEIIHHGHAGIPEIMDEDLDISLERMGKEYYEVFNKLV